MSEHLPATQTAAPQMPQSVAKNVPFIIPSTFFELVKFAEFMASSDFVPKDFRGKPANVALAMQWGIEIGLSPVQSLTSIAVINGRPGIFGDAAKALVEASPVCESIVETYLRDSSNNIIGARCVAKRKGRQAHTVEFTIDDAKKASLWNKEGPWRNYPSRMLQMRARSFALRDVFPDVLRGVGIVEELRDIIEGEAVVVSQSAPATTAVAMPKAREPALQDEPTPPAQTPSENPTQDDPPFPLHDDPIPDGDSAETVAEPQQPASTGPALTDGQTRTLDRTLERNGLTRIDVRMKWGTVHGGNLNDVLRWIPERARELIDGPGADNHHTTGNHDD